MFTTIAFMLASQASAAGLEFPKTLDERSYKFEWYAQTDPTMPASSDENWLDLEFWSGIVDCKREKLVETCTFKGGEVYHGYHTKDAEGIDSLKVLTPGTLTIEWTELGRMKKYEFDGNDVEFWTSSEESGRPRFKRMRKLQPNAVRRVGLQFEEALARKVIGLLEVERTPSSTLDRPWKPTATPWAARRYEVSSQVLEFQVGATKPSLESKVAHQENGLAFIATQGLVSESPSINSSTRDLKTQVGADAIIDMNSGLLVRNTVQTNTQGGYSGMLVTIQMLFLMEEGMTAEPFQLPGNPMAAGK